MIEGDYEDAGQLELNFQFDVCERTCDNLVTYRQVCAQVAREFGVIASFMPKPTSARWRTAATTTCRCGATARTCSSIRPAGAARRRPRGTRGGILAHAPGMLALCNPTVNSYARYWDLGQFAPGAVNWGFDNRTCAIRCRASGRLEYKLPDASVNPYLSHAAVLAAIAHGLDDRLDPGPPQAGDSYDPGGVAAAYAGSRARSATRSRCSRPTSVVRGALPPGLYDAFVEYKTDEWARFCSTVTDWHREMYLRALP